MSLDTVRRVDGCPAGCRERGHWGRPAPPLPAALSTEGWVGPKTQSVLGAGGRASVVPGAVCSHLGKSLGGTAVYERPTAIGWLTTAVRTAYPPPPPLPCPSTGAHLTVVFLTFSVPAQGGGGYPSHDEELGTECTHCRIPLPSARRKELVPTTSRKVGRFELLRLKDE